MKSIYLMFAIILIGMISFTSCTSNLEQTKEVKQTIKFSVSVDCDDPSLCAAKDVEDFIKNGYTNKLEGISCWVTSKTWVKGVMYGMGACSDGSTFSYH